LPAIEQHHLPFPRERDGRDVAFHRRTGGAGAEEGEGEGHGGKIVGDGRTEGRKDGRTEGRKDGRTEGRKDGRTEGRKDGRTEGEKDVRREGRKRGYGAEAVRATDS